jgi:D-alanyl-D-alanine carboxypeptidase
MRVLSTCLALLALAPATAQATAPPRSLQADVQAMVKTAKVPGGVLLIRSHGRTQVVAAGLADRATHAPMRADDRFRVASVTKPFVATLVLQLVGEGRLSLDDTVERWLPGLVPNGAQVTVRELLNHTAGLPEYILLPSVLNPYRKDRDHVFSARDLVRLAYATPAATNPPGAAFEYSNTNYVVAGLIVEAVTGQPLADELDSRIIQPLHLDHTLLPPTSRIPAPFAHGYTNLDQDLWLTPHGRTVDATRIDPSLFAFPGGLVSDVRDLARFMDALLGGNLLPEPERIAMTTPTGAAQVASDPVQGYGLGMVVGRNPCGVTYGHQGGIPGYRSFVARTRDGGRTGVLLLNGSPPTDDDAVRASRLFYQAFCR